MQHVVGAGSTGVQEVQVRVLRGDARVVDVYGLEAAAAPEHWHSTMLEVRRAPLPVTALNCVISPPQGTRGTAVAERFQAPEEPAGNSDWVSKMVALASQQQPWRHRRAAAAGWQPMPPHHVKHLVDHARARELEDPELYAGFDAHM